MDQRELLPMAFRLSLRPFFLNAKASTQCIILDIAGPFATSHFLFISYHRLIEPKAALTSVRACPAGRLILSISNLSEQLVRTSLHPDWWKIGGSRI
jgi:hypothetical protein